jgi:hypothetical protein
MIDEMYYWTYSTEAAVRPHVGASCVSRVPFAHLALALYRHNGAYDRLFSLQNGQKCRFFLVSEIAPADDERA